MTHKRMSRTSKKRYDAMFVLKIEILRGLIGLIGVGSSTTDTLCCDFCFRDHAVCELENDARLKVTRGTESGTTILGFHLATNAKTRF